MQDNNIDINSDSNSKDMTKFEEVNISEGY